MEKQNAFQYIINLLILRRHLIIYLITYSIPTVAFYGQFMQYQIIIDLYNQIKVLFFYTQNYPHSTYSQGIVLASVYFPLAKSKHKKEQYNQWLTSFFHIINCKLIFYTPKKLYDQLQRDNIINNSSNRNHLFHFNFTYNDIFEIPIMRSLTTPYKQMHEIDPEKTIHNPYLYAIWNSKIWFLREATFIFPDEKFYFWIDSGCVRENIYDSLFNKYGSFCNSSSDDKCDHLSFPKNNFVDDILLQTKNRPLDMCMFQVDPHKFEKYPKKKSKYNIFEGVFFGTKIGIDKFYNAFWYIHNKWLKRNIFCGKDQTIYNFVVENYFKKIEFYIFQTYPISERCNKWFVFISAFSKENPIHAPYRIYHLSNFLRY